MTPLAGRPARPVTRTSIVLWIDVLLLVLFLFTLAPRITGLGVHEWIGIVIAGLIVIHLLYSWQWIIVGGRRLNEPGPVRAKVNYMLNLALFVVMVLVIVAGLVISQVALPSLGVGTIEDGAWRQLHNASSVWVHLAVAAHLAMNWRWIVGAVRRHLWPFRTRAAREEHE